VTIAFTHPFCWPHVRRGAERFLDDVTTHLVEHGVDVVTVSSVKGAGGVEHGASGTRVLVRELWARPLGRIHVQPMHTFFLGCLAALRKLDVEAVHSLHYVDACAATLLARRRGFATSYYVTGVPEPSRFPRLPPDRQLLERAIRSVDRVFVPSEFVRERVARHYGVPATVLSPPIRLERFPLAVGPRPSRPTFVALADFDDPRKGLRVLVRAFARVKERLPDAVLRLSGRLSDGVRAEVLSPFPERVRADIEILGVGRSEDVPALYAGAHVTVLPSMWEAYGLVLLESWASGTPVAATDHGGISELLNDPALGALFEPLTDEMQTHHWQGLADAMLAALALAEKPETRARCRRRAEAFSWQRLGAEYMRHYAGR
jgi:phosphatidylinositol alpha-mannosyltransferase